MHLKHTGRCVCVLLLYAVTTITLPPRGRCWSAGQTPRPSPAPLHEEAGDFTTGGLGLSGAEPRGLPSSRHYLDNGHGAEAETSATTPDPAMAAASPDRRWEPRNKPKRSEPPNQDCGIGRVEHLAPGKFYITGRLETAPNAGYQADSAATVQPPGGPERIRGQPPPPPPPVGGSEESWQRLQPVVQCGDDAMTLTVRRRRAVQLQLDRVNESSVPLSQLPPQCGYSVQTTWRDLSLSARYDACYVTREDGAYALPLLWRGTPVQISCPDPRIQPRAAGPPSLCCSPHGMTVRMQGPPEQLSVNVRGEWTPLGELAEQCGYRLERQDAVVIMAAPFITCGVAVKDGRYSLSLQMGDKTFSLSCPVSPHEGLSLVRQPAFNGPPHLARRPAELMPESLDQFPWAPPFFLAPPHYPHPTYLHYPSPDEHAAVVPPTPASPPPGPTVAPHPLPPVAPHPLPPVAPHPLPPVASQPNRHSYDSYPGVEAYTHFGARGSPPAPVAAEDSGQAHHDLSDGPSVSERHGAARSPSSNIGLLTPAETPPPLQPPNHAFNPYYHYYHHPKIPLRGAPQDPHPGPRGVSSANPSDPEALALQRFLQPVPPAASHPPPPPEASALYRPPPPDPNHHYFPRVAQGPAVLAAPLNPEANLPDLQISESGASVDPPPCQSRGRHGHDSNTDAVEAELDAPVGPAVQPPLPPTPTPRPPPEQPSAPTPSPHHHLPPYPYYNPYYLYYRVYSRPEGSLGADHLASLTSVEQPPRASSSPDHQPTPPPTPPPTQPAHDVPTDPPHPHAYYYSHYNAPLYPYDAIGHPGGEEAEERLGNEMKDPLEAASPSPSASPSGLGRASYFDCSVSLGCCSYPVTDCTMGQHLIFAVPDSVVQPTVAPPAHPSEGSNMSCALQKLTSDLYAVPLDGCGVNTQTSGQTVVHRLEVLALQRDHSAELETSPIRLLLLECSSMPGFQSEVKLRVMDQPPPPAPALAPPPVPSAPSSGTVFLSIATDETFSSFHPEAHLPLSRLWGRSVHLQLSLPDPPEPGLLLLVHSCMAFTQAPHPGWMLVYDGCASGAQLLPSPRSNPHLIRRISFSGFRSLDSESPSYASGGGASRLGDPEIYFLCLIEVCSAAGGGCTLGCIDGPNGDARAMK